ncbi:type I 3-dehydroquinate dehydratase [Leptospira ognonensis]|uniref:3-dehydroquinate dehydratase n=1 Tax=Leptospira ognonensis TaxID=2484945 RepID=A0A4R9KD72_9LEPT|nr:type I 3-dehydroquinate dehydratase [Leptospira ognonensis]TGL63102.1 type I 3-dehydroquinate dehydratase [Leptospira ognonensis]
MPESYKIIATVGEDDIRNLQKKDTKDIDVIEVRLDLFSRNYIQKEMKKKIKSLGLPALFTYRRAEDSSVKSYVKLFPEDVEGILKDFNDNSNYLDIELNREDTIFTNYEQLNFRIIYSYHSFKKSIYAKEMKEFIQNSRPVKKKNPIFKFAITPEDIQETAEFMNDIKLLAKTNTMIGICMGESGIISRVFGDHFNSSYTYMTLGEPKAPGQISIETFRKFRSDLFKGSTLKEQKEEE